uniref:NADH-ubiquinone oxidoreductase chain 2 n=1 Tax=Sympiezomias velatus TaxID=2044628 RepID=A0A343L6P6_9CUCU|nr:NADH dehydrogenase subunit 2 [Sympiezomias velatus]
MMKLFKILFLNTMILGTLIAMSSYSWFSAWIGLEINLLSIIPLLKNPNNVFPSEAALKYFIAQAMASSMIMLSVLIFYFTNPLSEDFNPTQSILISTSLLLKMGAAPFHFWLPEVLSGLNWTNTLIMLTWQKIAPIMPLSYHVKSNIFFFSIIIILSSMISGIQGLNQICFRKILAYSSINHMSWMISTLLNSMMIFIYYFLIYTLINLAIIYTLKKFNIFYISQLSSIFSFSKIIKFVFILNFLSLGGLPPFLGFLPKWLTVYCMVENNFYMLSGMLIIFTLISLYFYLRITFSTFTLYSEETLLILFKKINFLYFIMNFFSLTGLFICSVMDFLY